MTGVNEEMSFSRAISIIVYLLFTLLLIYIIYVYSQLVFTDYISHVEGGVLVFLILLHLVFTGGFFYKKGVGVTLIASLSALLFWMPAYLLIRLYVETDMGLSTYQEPEIDLVNCKTKKGIIVTTRNSCMEVFGGIINPINCKTKKGTIVTTRDVCMEFHGGVISPIIPGNTQNNQ